MFQPGEKLVVVESMQSTSVDSVRLTPGLKGKVVQIDNDGDMLIDFAAFESLQWISRDYAKGFQKETIQVENGIWVEEEVSAMTSELQRLLAENNVSLLRALQDIRSEVKSGVSQRAENIPSVLAEMLTETNEKIALQSKLITGLALSVGEIRMSVSAHLSSILEAIDSQEEQGATLQRRTDRRSPPLDEHKPQTSTVPKIDEVEKREPPIDFLPVIKAIQENVPKIDVAPLMEEIRTDLFALLQGVRESNKMTMDQRTSLSLAAAPQGDLAQAVKELREEMRFSELLNTLEERRRHDEEGFAAILDSLLENKAKVVDSVRESLMEMHVGAMLSTTSTTRAGTSLLTSRMEAVASRDALVATAGQEAAAGNWEQADAPVGEMTAADGEVLPAITSKASAGLQAGGAEAIQMQLASVLRAVSEVKQEFPRVLGKLAENRKGGEEDCLAMLHALYENREQVVSSFRTAVGEIHKLSNDIHKGSEGMQTELSEFRRSSRKALAGLVPKGHLNIPPTVSEED